MKTRKIKITIWREGIYRVQYRYWEAKSGCYHFLGMCEHFINTKRWFPNDDSLKHI